MYLTFNVLSTIYGSNKSDIKEIIEQKDIKESNINKTKFNDFLSAIKANDKTIKFAGYNINLQNTISFSEDQNGLTEIFNIYYLQENHKDIFKILEDEKKFIVAERFNIKNNKFLIKNVKICDYFAAIVTDYYYKIQEASQLLNDKSSPERLKSVCESIIRYQIYLKSCQDINLDSLLGDNVSANEYANKILRAAKNTLQKATNIPKDEYANLYGWLIIPSLSANNPSINTLTSDADKIFKAINYQNSINYNPLTDEEKVKLSNCINAYFAQNAQLDFKSSLNNKPSKSSQFMKYLKPALIFLLLAAIIFAIFSWFKGKNRSQVLFNKIKLEGEDTVPSIPAPSKDESLCVQTIFSSGESKVSTNQVKNYKNENIKIGDRETIEADNYSEEIGQMLAVPKIVQDINFNDSTEYVETINIETPPEVIEITVSPDNI